MEKVTIARPYARAAFRHAREKSALEPWSQLLQGAKTAVLDPHVEPLLNHPKLDKRRLASIIGDVVKSNEVDGATNFFQILAENDRLALLPEIAGLFEVLRREHEKRAEVHVRTATDLTAAQTDLISQAMKRRLGRDVSVVVEVDENLYGGAIITVDDEVIDGSVLGRLARLRSTLHT
ncbi:MAG: F0F1 ATP synthase subunit delta [Pseudomonadota bacterium]|nr:F0F1 ATP synthase subunit delta [Pseudomonadota bacterium]